MLGKLFMLLLVAFAIGMAVPSTRATMMEKAKPVMDDVRARLVPRRLEAMADQLEARIGRGETYPGNWEAWLERDFSSIPRDPWDAYYYLQTNRTGFTVGSAGPDGQPNTADDITVTRRLPGR